MRLIAHRGNINGPIPERENQPDYIQEALDAGYDVEADIWYQDGRFYLGHDKPETRVSFLYLSSPRLWFHAKNPEALHIMIQYDDIHCFFIGDEGVTLTSKKIIYGYPTKRLPPQSVAIMIDSIEGYQDDLFGLCSDYVGLLNRK